MFGFQPGRREAQAAEQPRLGFRPRSKAAAVAEAQNQAPDSIPAMVKPGEFVLPPDTVHAMGGAGALQAAIDATHTPAPEQAFVPRGFKPKVFFANGGRPEDQIPLGGQRAAPAPDRVGGFGYQQNNQEIGQSIKDSWNQGNYGEAVGKTVAGTVGMVTTPIIDLAARGSSAAWDGAKGFGRGLVGADDGSQAPKSTPPDVKASAPAVTLGAGATAAARATAPSNNFAAVNEYSQAPSTGSASTSGQASQIAPGIFRSGNSYGDSAQAATLNNEPRGLPSRQNDLAAQNLAAQSTARGFTPGQRTEVEQPRLGFPGFRAPTVAHSGNDWQARRDLQNLETGASSIMNRPEFAAAGMARFRGGGAQSGPPPAVAAYQAALQTDSALRQAQPGLDAETMRQNAGLMREDMQQSGGVQREAMQQAGETGRTGMRLGIEQQRLQGEAEARGFKTRAQRQEEQLRNTLLDPNATPQQKQQAQQSMRAIRGDADPSPWALQVTPSAKNPDGSTSEGSVYRINKATGDVQRVDAGMAGGPKTITNDDAGRRALAALPSGSVYVGPDGKQYRKA